MFKKILGGILVFLGAFCVYVELQPADFKITRSATFVASPEVIFPQVNDLHSWQTWSPWAKMDPNSQVSYSGPQAGNGASFSWSGNDEVGQGRMTIIESNPNQLVRYRLEFTKPFTATNTAEFRLLPNGDRTKVTWSMSGTNGFLFKAAGVFMNCDKMVGDQYEKGFANLKPIVETKPTALE